MEENRSFMDKLMDFTNTIAAPLARFGQLEFIQAVTQGMVSAVGITLAGSLFLVFFLFAADGNLTQTALLPFLKPYAGQLVLVNSLSMNIMAIYMIVGMGSEYAKIKGFNQTTGAVGALFAFILLNYNGVASTADGVSAFEINYWGGAGLITAMIAAAIAINVIDICYKKNIKITLPDSVPPAIADSFSAVIPYFIIVLICWGTRTILNINIPELVAGMLLPVLSAADNIFIFTLAHFLISVLWTVGLHGDNIVGAVTNSFTNIWMQENTAAFSSGAVAVHNWTPNLNRLFMWVSSCWVILFYMYKDSKKLPQLKPLAVLCSPAMIFSIVEPMMFGLPVVLNPYLIIPFVVSHTITAAVSYALTASGFVGRMVISLPWATPAPLLGYLGTAGSVGGIILVVINFAIGLAIFYPFWTAYVKAEQKRIAEEEAAQ